MSLDVARISHASSQYALPKDFKPTYGTAGFRNKGTVLASTVFRCGLLTAVRAGLLGQACGLMITASHNPEPDNGVKIVEPDGGMLVEEWEGIATELANAGSDAEVAQRIQGLLDGADHAGGTVLLGRDTRPSGPELLAAAKAGVEAAGGVVVDLGQVTTPQLHFMVVEYNTRPTPATRPQSPPSLDIYFSTLLDAFEQLVSSSSSGSSQPAAPYTLHVDCACGIGATHLQTAANKLAAGKSGLRFALLNTPGPPGSLNHCCGADYVQKEQVAPAAFQDLPTSARCCCVDGDADRLVYFQLQAAGSGGRGVRLLDGDRIAALAACLVKHFLKGLPDGVSKGMRVGVVQTAYANGGSTHYLTHNQGLTVACTKTGVKHLHPVAHTYDIGIYFEANGHGTVLFSYQLLTDLEELSHIPSAKQLLCLSRCVNQTVGDALSCILLTEAALRLLGLDIDGWLRLYEDLPSRQRKLVVKDRYVVVSNDPAERRVCAPAGLQEAIDSLVAAAGEQARAFVRASGTEDAIRVYAEARTQQAADQLALDVSKAVYELAGGVGSPPK